jgi:hypothetical protein
LQLRVAKECLIGLYSDWNESLRMPDFPLREFGKYHVRLRPSDWFREMFDSLSLPVLNYFNSSETCFDLRVTVPNIKENRHLSVLLKYEWQLFTESDKPVALASDPQYQFYNVADGGEFELVTRKSGRAERKSTASEYQQYASDGWVGRVKLEAVKIGELSRLGHYKIVMRFADGAGDWNSWAPIAHFTIVDKDKLKQALLIGIGSGFIGTVLAVAVLHISHLV